MTARTALRATALATAALALTACNSTKTKPTPPPAAAPAATATATTGGSSTAAGSATAGAKGQDLAAKIPLTAKEWGNTFVQDDPYEDVDLHLWTLDASCHLKDSGKDAPGITGSMRRTVTLPKAGGQYKAVFANSSADVYDSAASAHTAFAGAVADNRKCPGVTYDDGGKDAGVHEVKAPTVQGADEVTAVEGTTVFALDGGKNTDPFPFMTVTARKGTVLVSVTADIETGESVGAAEIYVQSALKKLTAKW